jgi:hypothetical protein
MVHGPSAAMTQGAALPDKPMANNPTLHKTLDTDKGIL